MIVDSSAILAILLQEDESEAFRRAIDDASRRRISALSKLEVSMVAIARKGTESLAEIDAFIAATGLEVTPFDDAQAQVAREAFARFGKGRHPAGLNFGDCCVYALARVTGEPLLYKGGDFAATDIPAAL